MVDMLHVFSLTKPPSSPLAWSVDKGTSSEFLQVPRLIYREGNFSISFIFPSYFFTFLHIFVIFPGFGKIPSSPLGPGIRKNSDISSYI